MTDGKSELPAATRLAVDRTRLAHERTLMAWVRTSTALISFGFTIHKFFEYLRQDESTPPPNRVIGPREFALLMIGMGVLALVVATIEHRRNLEALRKEYGAVPYSLATYMAVVVAVVGCLGLATVMLRL